MPLVNVFAGLAEALGPEVGVHGPTEQLESGGTHLHWEPLTDRHLAPKRIGGGALDDGPILTCQWRVLVRLIAPSFAETEAFRDRVMAVFHDLLSAHSYDPGEGNWVKGDDPSGAWRYDLTIFIASPILRTPAQTRPITAINQTFLYETS